MTEDQRGGRKNSEVKEPRDYGRDDFLKTNAVCGAQCSQQKSTAWDPRPEQAEAKAGLTKPELGSQ